MTTALCPPLADPEPKALVLLALLPWDGPSGQRSGGRMRALASTPRGLWLAGPDLLQPERLGKRVEFQQSRRRSWAQELPRLAPCVTAAKVCVVIRPHGATPGLRQARNGEVSLSGSDPGAWTGHTLKQSSPRP